MENRLYCPASWIISLCKLQVVTYDRSTINVRVSSVVGVSRARVKPVDVIESHEITTQHAVRLTPDCGHVSLWSKLEEDSNSFSDKYAKVCL